MDTLEHSTCGNHPLQNRPADTLEGHPDGKYFYRAVVFDLDGTLLNTLDDLSTAVNLLCREKHWPQHSMEQVRAMVGHGMDNLLCALSPVELSPAEHQRTLARLDEHYRAHCMEKTAPYPGMTELLVRLRADGVKTAVCSNKPDEFTRRLIAHYFPGVFNEVRGHVPELPVKPDPAIVYAALSAMGNPPQSQTLYTGDSATDIQTGHHAGLDVCAVSWGFRGRESLEHAAPEYLADSVPELEQILQHGRHTKAK